MSGRNDGTALVGSMAVDIIGSAPGVVVAMAGIGGFDSAASGVLVVDSSALFKLIFGAVVFGAVVMYVLVVV